MTHSDREAASVVDSLSPLATPSATRAVLEAHGLATKHALGQNFLVNDAIVRKIVALAEVGAHDFVLEVGPGIGTLTIALLKNAHRVVAVERDRDLAAVLADTCAPWASSFSLVIKDALDLREDDMLTAGGDGAPAAGDVAFGTTPSAGGSAGGNAASTHDPVCRDAAEGSNASHGDTPAMHELAFRQGARPNKLVANLPYAVAATVVLDYFERFPFLESATVMVQKEVADRMAAQPGSKSYGAYTVKLRLFAQVAGRFPVGPGNFFPPPRVESAVLRLNRRALGSDGEEPLDARARRATCIMADAAFANRRKTLANSCKAYFAAHPARGAEGGQEPRFLPSLFERAGIDPQRRGETLGLAEFVRLGLALEASGFLAPDASALI